ncbi:response regulator transcription factor [Marinigracilibium pacificum]|uniref:Response regulator transcription factor n=1 Tax=Marinigracilibium pacificum TaxID=2729599 RepID=A0A848ISK5_9BACT|nr:response regulator transcription factor [Marinigracilibium pacificum]NMM46766.1 response regulator transcription factor [Marinigracilibium pacificum]
MSKYKLLIVEDDPNLGQILKEYLEVKGFETHLCRDGEEGLEAYKKEEYHACLFDIMMPKMDGFTLLEKVRKMDKEVPVIFLTAKSMKEDTLHGLRIGADDYITKPFSMEELLLRLNNILKRSGVAESEAEKSGELKFGDFEFDYTQRILNHQGNTTKLTTKEAELLKLLVQNKNKTLDRSMALNRIWKDDSYFNARSMDVYIAKLRKMLKPDETVQILTVHGEGFKLIELKE